jgi:SAM-dependent methyltransferase
VNCIIIMASTRNTYDEVPYPSAIYPQTHPDQLGALAKLAGMRPHQVDSCRVLELGCGDGLNLIAMAVALPGSQFTGLDLAGVPIARGKEIVSALQLQNVSLLDRDLSGSTDDLGTFDFIIAHGLYSWVPDPVRKKILAVCSRCLADEGVAYISYNAYPGNHFREMVRGLMRFHTARLDEPEAQIAQAKAILKFMSAQESASLAYGEVWKQELQRVERYPAAALFHDDLSPTNQAFYFHEFAAAAAEHGLQYLGEADVTDMQTDGLPPECTRLLEQFGPENRIAREQYLDYFRARAFRQTLLCHGKIALDRSPLPERIFDLYVASTAQPTTLEFDPCADDALEFRTSKNAVIATQHPKVKAALCRLGQAWPQRIPFQELAEGTASIAGEEEAQDRLALARFLLAAHAIGVVELHTHPGSFVTTISERPRSSALARWQLETGDKVATLRHTVMQLEGSLSRELVKSLDGTRTRDQVSCFLTDYVCATQGEGSDRNAVLARVEVELEMKLKHLASGALLQE